jgi:predicted secreted protein
MKRAASFGMVMLFCAALVVAAGCDDAVRIDDGDNGGSILEQEGDAEYDSDAPPGMMGAGGQETWRFTAIEPGEGTLRLEYRSPWEEESDAAGTFEVGVVVQ